MHICVPILSIEVYIVNSWPSFSLVWKNYHMLILVQFITTMKFKFCSTPNIHSRHTDTI